MTLKEKIGWKHSSPIWEKTLADEQNRIFSGKAVQFTYYCYASKAYDYAVECFLVAGSKTKKKDAETVVHAALEYFYGNWRKTLTTPDGKTGQAEWNSFCLWYEEVIRSLPWASALGDWESVRKIAEYPPENMLPEASKAKGETAWVWALVTFLRGHSKNQIEPFLKKAETDNAKRPKLLCPVLRALLDKDEVLFGKALLTYLAYYRKNEFKMDSEKVLALTGTTLYHLGRKQGFEVNLPENVADHIIRLQK